MTSDLSQKQTVVLEILANSGDYAAAYRYIADIIGTEHEAHSWFDAAVSINAHANQLAITVEAAYAQNANAVTDLFLDTDPSENRLFELSRLRTHNQKMTVAARAIAERKTFGQRS